MGLALSALISYAGVREALECLYHISRGMLPDVEPDFRDLVEYWTILLQKSANLSNSADWTRKAGQGYLCLTEDKEGKLKSAAVKYYDGQPDSTAVLFSTKISSFGQESVESNSSHSTQANGDYRSERSLDGIKIRPLQRNDPTGRRRSFKKRHSSSSTSSRESRQSREEELKIFTSLEEAEFERMSAEHASFGSSPNLNTRSYSRSRSREKSNERTHSWDIPAPEDTVEVRPRLKDVSKLESFEEEEKEDVKEKVTEEDDLDDFWGSGD